MKTNDEVKHTPTPWHYTVGADSGTFPIWKSNEIMHRLAFIAMVANADESYPYKTTEANAAFIVKACNAHDELLKAAKIALAWMGVNATKSNEIEYVKSRGYVLKAIANAEGE